MVLIELDWNGSEISVRMRSAEDIVDSDQLSTMSTSRRHFDDEDVLSDIRYSEFYRRLAVALFQTQQKINKCVISRTLINHVPPHNSKVVR